MAHSLYNFIISSLRLLNTPRVPQKHKLIAAYAKIRLKSWWMSLRGQNATHENVLGFRISFFNYKAFVYLFEEIFMNQQYLFKTNKTEPMILDCGANIGVAMLYFKWLYPACKIKCFEPDIQTFLKLRENVLQNKLNNVELFNVALADKAGEVEFFSEAQEEGSLIMGITPRQKQSVSSRVTCQPLSLFLQDTIDFLKMDIEGAEALCLEEVEEKRLLSNVQQMVVECHHNIPGPKNLNRVIGALEKNSFQFQVSATTKNPFLKDSAQDVILYAHSTGSC